MNTDLPTVRVWDLPTRIFHWSLAASFLIAFVTSESEKLRDLHVVAGYAMAGLIAFRILTWGTVLALFVWRVIRPLARRITDAQVALYLEEHESSLDGAVLGAVATGSAPTTHATRGETHPR